MHRNPVELLLLAALCLCFCGGGGSYHLRKGSPEQVDQYLVEHPDLPSVDKACIEDGRVQIGMRQETLLFMLGEPTRRETVKQPWTTQEVWYYTTDGKKAFTIEKGIVVGISETTK